MSRTESAVQRAELPSVPSEAPTLAECIALLDLRPGDIESLPFGPGDVTAGSETELQVAVVAPAAVRRFRSGQGRGQGEGDQPQDAADQRAGEPLQSS